MLKCLYSFVNLSDLTYFAFINFEELKMTHIGRPICFLRKYNSLFATCIIYFLDKNSSCKNKNERPELGSKN